VYQLVARTPQEFTRYLRARGYVGSVGKHTTFPGRTSHGCRASSADRQGALRVQQYSVNRRRNAKDHRERGCPAIVIVALLDARDASQAAGVGRRLRLRKHLRRPDVSSSRRIRTPELIIAKPGRGCRRGRIAPTAFKCSRRASRDLLAALQQRSPNRWNLVSGAGKITFGSYQCFAAFCEIVG
jgi:hypothetical protein